MAVLLVGWFLLTSVWSVYRDDEGVRRHAALNLAVGGPALAASGVLLVREWRRQAEVSRLLDAWLRMIDQPALRAVLSRWRADPSTAIAPPRSAISPLTLFWMSLLRMAWRVVGAAALLLAAILLASPLASSSDDLAEADPGGGDNLLVTVATMLFWGLVLLATGWRALWKSLKRRYRVAVLTDFRLGRNSPLLPELRRSYRYCGTSAPERDISVALGHQGRGQH